MRTFWIYTMASLVFILGYVSIELYMTASEGWHLLMIFPSLLVFTPAMNYWLSYFRKRIQNPVEKKEEAGV